MSDPFAEALASKVASLQETTPEAEVEAPEQPEQPEQPESETEIEPEGEAEALEPEVEEPEDLEQSEQPRDEKGRFAPKERPEWLPPQFKSEEDFARSYGELQSLLGRQGQELGELRQIAQQIAAGQSSARPSDVFPNMEDALAENPEQVAIWALWQGHVPGESVLMDQVLDAWYEVAPRAAAKFERDIDLARLKHEFSQEVQPSIEEARRESLRRAAQIAQRDLRGKYDDFEQVMSSLTEADLDGLNPKVLQDLQESDPKAAIELIYRWVRSTRQAETQASKDADREASLERKRRAAVATASSSPVERTKDAKELLRDFFSEPEAHSVRHGLTE